MNVPDDMEAAITRRGWTDPEFPEQVRHNPVEALSTLGIEVPKGLAVDIRVQQRNTLYFCLPPVPRQSDHGMVNQMDLWGTAEMFVWAMPLQVAPLGLAMRKGFHPEKGGRS
ncbi:nitrile hydratase [Nocardia transvalensis]|uniref:nitrile hydratase n=1 Tax=Nocardia transvalensis TaxID=37333 RepID=UPI0018947662|nr:nitrile hydratase [Nocardia transvalensis]MBF6332219.1 nitrile hydratase [Nocardia transvalensis]